MSRKMFEKMLNIHNISCKLSIFSSNFTLIFSLGYAELLTIAGHRVTLVTLRKYPLKLGLFMVN